MTDRAKMTPDNTRSGLFDRIYRAYQAELLGFFRRCAHDPHAADDLVNTVYVQLLKSQPKSPIRDHRAYLFQCARRVLSRENRRARQRDAQTVSGDPQLWDSDPSHLSGLPHSTDLSHSTKLWIADDTATALTFEYCLAALHQLSEPQKKALLLRLRDKLSYAQIAEQMAVSNDVARNYVRLAREAIRTQIGADVPKGTSGATP